jgi:hypothetical protein
MERFDGNAEQVRLIAAQVAEAMELSRGGGWKREITSLKEDLERDIDVKIDSAVTRMKFWVISAVLAQVVPLVPIIFLLGGIYATNNAALELMKKQQEVLESYGARMNERDIWQQGVEQWAGPKGFVPPRERR